MSPVHGPQGMPADGTRGTNLGRRDFVRSSSVVLLASALPQPDLASAIQQSAALPTRGQKIGGFFRWNDTYTNQDVEKLYQKRPGDWSTRLQIDEAFRLDIARGVLRDRRHMIFFYDADAKKMVNPLNVKPTLQPGGYSMEATIRNFHVSKKDFDGIWRKLKPDAQMQLALTASAPDDDDLTWTLMNGIDIFLGGKLEGLDQRLRPLLENNKPTSKFRPSAKIEVRSGSGEFQLQVAAQKKESIWRKILSIGGAVVNSPLFATLPIPKLVPQGLQFVNAVLDHLESTERLTPIWTSAKIPFRLYEGARKANPFALRPGFWATIDRTFAEQHLDANQNLTDVFLNLGGQFFELATANGQPINANYSVMELGFPALGS